MIAYFVLRDSDPELAKICLWLGIMIAGIELTFIILVIAVFGINIIWPDYYS